MNIIPTCKYEVQQILKAHYAQYFLNRSQIKKIDNTKINLHLF